jgi:alkaline phosphatase D
MPAPNDPERVFRSVRLGDLAEIFLLDTRTRRDEPVAGEAMLDPGRTQLGPDQKKWFMEGISESRARWKLIGNSSVMCSTWADHIPEQVKPSLIALKLVAAGGLALDPDQWDGYPFEREELLMHIRDNVSGNTVVLSGDVHIAMANELRLFGDVQPIAPEFVTTSLTTQNIDEKMHWDARTKSVEVERMLMEAMPHIRWCDFDSHGYILIDVDPQELRAEWWFVDTVLKRTDSEESGAAWAVRNGERGLHPIKAAGALA